MSSRPRDTGRHYASGSAKRKAKDEKEKKNQAVISKTRKLSEFFNVQNDVPESKEIEVENTEVASHCTDDDSTIGNSLGSVTISDIATFTTSDTALERTASPPNSAISSSSQREVKSTASPLDPETSSSSQREVESISHASDVTTSSTSQKQNESKIYSNDIGQWPSNLD